MPRLIPLILGAAVLAGCGTAPVPLVRPTVPQGAPLAQSQGMTRIVSADVVIGTDSRTVMGSSGQKVVWQVTTHDFKWVETVKGLNWHVNKQKRVEIHETTIPGTQATHVKYYEDGLQLSDPTVDNGPYKRLYAHYDKMVQHLQATKRDQLQEYRQRFFAYSQWNGVAPQLRR